jgi:hypothetical protein
MYEWFVRPMEVVANWNGDRAAKAEEKPTSGGSHIGGWELKEDGQSYEEAFFHSATLSKKCRILLTETYYKNARHSGRAL